MSPVLTHKERRMAIHTVITGPDETLSDLRPGHRHLHKTVAEISRIFLGVQIQCAQCHDHPTDRWTREQFHELAAFFPRVASRIVLTPDRREISVVVNDAPRAMGFRGPMNIRRNGTPEHYMSDLQNPQSRGKLMQPVFFATGDNLPPGARECPVLKSHAHGPSRR